MKKEKKVKCSFNPTQKKVQRN